ncbi:hypothetical protein EJB05_46818, partial [Eragrostis curvula]
MAMGWVRATTASARGIFTSSPPEERRIPAPSLPKQSCPPPEKNYAGSRGRRIRPASVEVISSCPWLGPSSPHVNYCLCHSPIRFGTGGAKKLPYPGMGREERLGLRSSDAPRTSRPQAQRIPSLASTSSELVVMKKGKLETTDAVAEGKPELKRKEEAASQRALRHRGARPRHAPPPFTFTPSVVANELPFQVSSAIWAELSSVDAAFQLYRTKRLLTTIMDKEWMRAPRVREKMLMFHRLAR